MTSFVFWNLMKKDLRELAGRAAAERAADVVLLAECAVPDAEMSAALKSATGAEWAALSSPKDKVRVFTRLQTAPWRRTRADGLGRAALWEMPVGKSPGVLLCVAHLVGKANASPIAQAMQASKLAETIRAIEDRLSHQRTVLVGDLNMNPFDPGVIGAPALHAVMTKRIAARIERVDQGAPAGSSIIPCGGCSETARRDRLEPTITVPSLPTSCSGTCPTKSCCGPL